MSFSKVSPIARQASSSLASRLPRSSSSRIAFNASTSPILSRSYASDKPPLSSEPLPAPRPIYPPPTNPFQPPPQSSPSNSSTQQTGTQHSPLKVSIVKALAKLMGYNSRSVTAIRETGNMCGAIVRAVERDHEFWYNECALAPTYQTFFQLHLLYLLLLLPRLRSLPNPTSLPGTSNPPSQTYQTELLTHFFALAENQMRLTLGEGERERVVKKYMKEMGEQWKGAGVGFDYAIAIGQELPELSAPPRAPGMDQGDVLGGDSELAAWVWRNLFAARYSDLPTDFTPSAPSSSPTDSSPTDPASPITHLKLPTHLSAVVTFIRKELHRLDQLENEDIMQGRIGEFGRVKENGTKRGAGEETVDGA